jgi:hypothetical protein
MAVHVTLVQRLGNNLFQYAVGRIIAEHHGLALHCTPRPYAYSAHWERWLGRRGNPGPIATLDALTEFFPNAPLHLPGRTVTTPVESHEITRGGTWKGHIFDLGRILADPTPRQIRLYGFFQRYEYFEPYRQRIREWFRPRPVPTPWTIMPSDVVVNIRRGTDFGVENWTLSLSYYERILDQLGDRGRVYVCGVGVDDHVRERLARFDPTFYDASPIEHFAFMMRFRRIVLSNSTFAWWAAFLSDAEEIYAPRSADGQAYGFTGWQKEEVDLHMREARYIEVVDAELAAFVPFAVRPLASDAVVRRALDTLEADSHELWSWMTAQKGPITIRELLAPHRHIDVRKALEDLSAAGLVAADVSYIESRGAPSSRI